jgi:hypothetical protein
LRAVNKAKIRPVLVSATPDDAAQMLYELLVDYQAELREEDGTPLVHIEPVDDFRRGTVIYRVIQASRTVSARYPDSLLYLITEDGSRWRLPPPAL